jgi:hypothetical protein
MDSEVPIPRSLYEKAGEVKGTFSKAYRSRVIARPQIVTWTR